jgi:outer membrane autotransporter protein
MTVQKSPKKSLSSLFIISTALISGVLALLTPDWKQQLLAAYGVDAAIERANIVATTEMQTKITQSSISAKISEIPDAELNTLGSRLNQLRLDNNESPNFLSAGDHNENFDRLGLFMNGNYTFGEGMGFEQKGTGTTLGADYRLTDYFVLGLLFAYNYTQADFNQSAGMMETDAFSGALYGSFMADNGFYMTGVVSGKALDYQVQRNIANTHVTGKNNGDKYTLNISSGYDHQLNGLTLTPQLRLNYSHVHIDPMNEQGRADLALHMDAQNFDTLKSSLGMQAAYPLSFSWGVLMPTLAVDWTHEFFYSSRSINAYFIQDSGWSNKTFDIVTNSLEKDFMNLSVGASVQLKQGLSMFFNYESILAHKTVKSHLLTAGVRIEF